MKAVHCLAVYLYHTRDAVLFTVAPLLWTLLGAYAGLTRDSSLLTGWGLVTALCTGSFLIAYLMSLPDAVAAVVLRLAESKDLTTDVMMVVTAVSLLTLYVASAVRAVSLPHMLSSLHHSRVPLQCLAVRHASLLCVEIGRDRTAGGSNFGCIGNTEEELRDADFALDGAWAPSPPQEKTPSPQQYVLLPSTDV